MLLSNLPFSLKGIFWEKDGGYNGNDFLVLAWALEQPHAGRGVGCVYAIPSLEDHSLEDGEDSREFYERKPKEELCQDGP